MRTSWIILPGISFIGVCNLLTAATNTWLGTSSDWNTPSNWSLSSVPALSDDVVIPQTSNNPDLTSIVNAEAQTLFLEPSSGIDLKDHQLNISDMLTLKGLASLSDTSFGTHSRLLFSSLGATGIQYIYETSGPASISVHTVQFDPTKPLLFSIEEGNALEDLTLTSAQINSYGILKRGLGILEINSSLLYSPSTGDTTIEQGTIKASATLNSLPTTTIVHISEGATLSIPASTSQTISGLSGKGALEIIVPGSLTIDNSDSQTFPGTLLGEGIFIKQGIGTLFLSGESTSSSGAMVVNAGTLWIQNNTAIGTRPLIMQGGTTLSLDDQITLSNPITGSSGTVSFNVPNGSATFNSGFNCAAFEKVGAGSLSLASGGSAYVFDTASSVTEGTLTVNYILSGSSLTVGQNATLSGSGFITMTDFISYAGKLKPGIPSLQLNGNQIFETTSTLQINVNGADSSLASITGDLTIQPGATVELLNFTEQSTAPYSYQIVTYTGVRSGTFLLANSFSSLPPAQQLKLSYPAGEINLAIDIQFPTNQGSANAAANAMNNFVAHPCGNSADLVSALSYLPTIEALDSALLQTMPSAFTALAIAQENAQLYVRNAIYNRLEESLHSCCARDLNQKNRVNAWIGPLLGHASQDSQHKQPGFTINSPGVFAGMDGLLGLRSAVGLGLGFTRSHLKWKQNRGDADIQTIYLSVYGKWATPKTYIESALIGGYGFYDARRKVEFGGSNSPFFSSTAQSSYNGLDGSAHLKAGLKYGCSRWIISPFAGADYIATHEDSFTETHANSLNLHVESHLANLLTSEAGVDFAYCSKKENHSLAPFLKLSAIRESRFKGEKERAHFHCGGYPINGDGFIPSRTLAGIGAGLNATFGLGTVSLSYQGRLGSHFTDNSGSIEFLKKF